MIKVYIDWCVMSQMKGGLHSSLFNIIFENKKLLIPFSTSHIGDIFSSYKESQDQSELIDSDLNYISKLTNDICLYNNGKDVVLDYYSPIELFRERIENKEIYSTFNFEKIINSFKQNKYTDENNNTFADLLKTNPIVDSLKNVFENPVTSENLKKILPGFEENQTIEGLLKSINQMFYELNESESYKDLRKNVQFSLGINRDKIYDSKAPFDIIDNVYKKHGISENVFDSNIKNTPVWFNEILNKYTFLDLLGYQEDNINIKKGRKETFKNTTEDALHAMFASTCNFYITNDNKSYNKTKMIYDKLQINTLVLKPDEFVTYYKKYLDIKDSFINLSLPIEIFKIGKYHEDEIENGILRTYFVPYFFFDFFNKLMIFIPDNDERTMFMYSRISLSNKRIYMMEIKQLVSKISELLGNDIDNIGEIKEDEFTEDDWIGRKWKIKDITYRLIRLNGHFQLYIDLK